MPVGYKVSEVGVIPDDWVAGQLGSIASFRTGPFGSSIHKSDYRDGGVPLINPMHIVDGAIIPSAGISVGPDDAKRLTPFQLDQGDVIIGRRGEMGRCAYVSHRYAGWLCGTGSMIVRPNEQGEGRYIQRVLSSPNTIKAILETSVGMTMINLNQSVLAKLWIAIPDKREQSAIADALSDMDEAIAAQEAVIAKKRALKTATMQALLSGTCRLPGFSGEWGSRPLAALCSMKSGFGITSKSLSDYGPYRCFGGNGFRGFTDRYTHEGVFPLVGRVGALCGNVTLAEGKFFASEHAIVVSPNSDTSALWLAIVLRDLNLNKFSEASAQPVLVVSKILLIHCLTPPTKDEQEAIALVAMDMDSDIAADNAQLAKLRQVKTGMMQQLLTGKIRLV